MLCKDKIAELKKWLSSQQKLLSRDIRTQMYSVMKACCIVANMITKKKRSKPFPYGEFTNQCLESMAAVMS